MIEIITVILLVFILWTLDYKTERLDDQLEDIQDMLNEISQKLEDLKNSK